MPGRRSESRRLALGGIFGALCVAAMLTGNLLPFATFAAPAIAGLLIVPVAIEFGMRTGWLLYAAVGLLSLFLVPDREMSLIFVFFFGFYPLVKAYIERLRARAVKWVLKLAVFNVCVLAMYALLLFVFPLPSVVQEFEESGPYFAALLLAAGNLTFLVYDIAVARLTGLYCARLRPRLTGRL